MSRLYQTYLFRLNRTVDQKQIWSKSLLSRKFYCSAEIIRNCRVEILRKCNTNFAINSTFFKMNIVNIEWKENCRQETTWRTRLDNCTSEIKLTRRDSKHNEPSKNCAIFGLHPFSLEKMKHLINQLLQE